MPGDLLSFLLAHLGEDTCLILTGEIGAGKTCTAERLVAALKEQGIAVGGVLSPRILHEGKTVGYTIRDLDTGKEQPFAQLDPPGFPVGKFFIAEDGLLFARSAIDRAAANAQVVFVDEVGRLELAGKGLAPAVRALLRSEALPVLLVRSAFLDAVLRSLSIARFTVFSINQEEPHSRRTKGVSHWSSQTRGRRDNAGVI